jgi:arylsulfatase A-like enzyme
MDVHYDYNPPSPYDTFFDPDYQGSVTSRDFMNNPAIRKDMDKRDLDHIIALYDGEIRYADSELGKLFGYLRELGEWDNTVVVLTADHGDEFFEHGWKGHRQSLYDEVLLVPLILRYPPALPRGRRVAEQVRLIDIAPTLLELTGTPGSDVVWGGIQPLYAPRSLTAALDDESPPDASRRPAFTHLSDVFAYRPVVLYSLRTDDMKIAIEGDGSGEVELFDLSTDPGEQHNLAGQSNPLEPQLRGTLTRWKSTEQDTGTRRTATPAEQEELRGLGYIQ